MIAAELAWCLMLVLAVSSTATELGHRSKRFTTQKKCFGEFGCFSTGGDFYVPFIRPLHFLPLTPEAIAVRFYLFTKENPNTAQELKFNDSISLLQSNFEGNRTTKIITHGFLENGLVPWIATMRKDLLLSGDHNVIQLDWSGGSQLPYAQATANTRMVGAVVAHMIKFLEQNADADRKDFHFIGHSLGAHVGGYIGEKLDGKLGRITGLDPAGPYFEKTKPAVRLDPTDALMVDVIHTDGNHLLNAITLNGGMGTMQAMGHVDFYPNGGRKQPDCSTNPLLNIIIKGVIEGTKWTVACYHLRVLPLFTDTVLASRACRFKAYQCDSYENFKAGKCSSCKNGACNYMGFHAKKRPALQNNPREVKMFLDTAGKENFCVHEYFLKISTGSKSLTRSIRGNMFVTFFGSNGSTKEIQFFDESQEIEQKTSYSRAFDDVNNIGTIKRVVFRWQFSKGILDGRIFKRYLYLDQISLVNGEDESTAKFCGGNSPLASGYRVILYVGDSYKC